MNALLNPTSPATDLPVHGHLINGQHVADAVRMQDVWNPSTGAVGSRVAIAGKATVEAAIAAAQAAAIPGLLGRRSIARATLPAVTETACRNAEA